MIPFLASLVVRVTVITLAALAATRLARNSRASIRHVVLAAALTSLLVVPLFAFAAPVRIAVPISVPAEVASIPVETNVNPGPVATVTDTSGETRTADTAPWPSWSLLTSAVWALGMLLFGAPIAIGLWQIRRLRRGALPWRQGQTIVDLLARESSMTRRVDALIHEDVPSPMTCGVYRPAIVLPVEAARWNAQDLHRALVHELEHIRRVDWMTQGVARLACAVYWFHPLVWTAWRELSLEAERACDDAVLRRPSTGLRAGSDAAEYADQLVLLAERLSAATNAAVLAMANRADLAARVRAVLDGRRPRGRAGLPWITLACGISMLLVMTVSSLKIVSASAEPTADWAAQLEQAPANGPRFAVISIRPCDSEPPTPPGQRSSQGGFPNTSPGRFTVECGALERLIGIAYVTHGEQLTNQAARYGDVEWLKNVPGWVRDERFTIEAQAEGTPDANVMLGPMLRALLEDRFKLKIHRANDEVPMYEMNLAKGGLKITPDTCTDRDPADGPPTREYMASIAAGGRPLCGNMTMTRSERGLSRWTIGGETMTHLAGTLSTFMDHHVIDKTGVTDTFNIRLEFAIDEHVPGPDKRYGPPTPPASDVEGPNIFKALEQQIGVTLTPTKGPHGFLVIDHVEHPSPNRGPGLRSLHPPAVR